MISGLYLVIAVILPNAVLSQVASEYLGGPGGDAFDDKAVAQNGDITRIEMQCTDVATYIKLRYGKVDSRQWGWANENCIQWSKKGEKVVHELSSGEYITSAIVTYGKYVQSITFKTNKRTLPRCGTSATEKSVTVLIPGGLKYISGRWGCRIDGLRFHAKC
nr:PPL3-a [Pteria penguin]